MDTSGLSNSRNSDPTSSTDREKTDVGQTIQGPIGYHTSIKARSLLALLMRSGGFKFTVSVSASVSASGRAGSLTLQRPTTNTACRLHYDFKKQGSSDLLADTMFQRKYTVVSGQINPDWNCPQANYMSTSFKTDDLICSFYTPATFNWPHSMHRECESSNLYLGSTFVSLKFITVIYLP
jgi:hypothetical protein